MESQIILRELEKKDLSQIARVHISSFPESALTKLGEQTVERYYAWQLDGAHRKVRAVGAFSGDDCLGFSFSGIFNGSTSGFIRRNKAFLAKEVMLRPQLLFNRLFLKRTKEGIRSLASLRKRKRDSKPDGGSSVPLAYGILSIAVAANCQKSGIGQLLMRDAETEAVKYGCEKICLTVHPDNAKAVRFYEKQNWQKLLQSGLWNGAMVKALK